MFLKFDDGAYKKETELYKENSKTIPSHLFTKKPCRSTPETSGKQFGVLHGICEDGQEHILLATQPSKTKD